MSGKNKPMWRAAVANKTAAAMLAMILVVGLLLGVAVALFVLGNQKPKELQSETKVAAVPVTEREYDDARSVDLVIDVGPARNLSSGTAGRITASSCVSGNVAKSGGSNFAVDGKPLINLATEIPLWRDIDTATQGDDVLALQKELIRLGYNLTPNGRSSRHLINGVNDLLKTAGAKNVDKENISVAQIVWLPTVETPMQGCEVVVGQSIDAGGSLAKIPGGATVVSVAKLPEDAIAGERVVKVGELTLQVDAAGRVTDDVGLGELAKTSEYKSAIADKSLKISAFYALKEAIKIAVVPPGALYNIVENNGCVVSDKGDTFKVDLIASELGSSFVIFPGGKTPENVSLKPEDQKACE